MAAKRSSSSSANAPVLTRDDVKTAMIERLSPNEKVPHGELSEYLWDRYSSVKKGVVSRHFNYFIGMADQKRGRFRTEEGRSGTLVRLAARQEMEQAGDDDP